MPQVSLVEFTGKGSSDPARHAANLLVFTKSTRLNMSPSLMEAIEGMSNEEIAAELGYMARTIPSSWEFVDYTFLIQGVTRAFTHQLVRTRNGSYAQQTMRILDVTGWDYSTGPSIPEHPFSSVGPSRMKDSAKYDAYHGTMAVIAEAYNDLIDAGAAIEDARGVLPTNIHTNIVAKFNLRTLAEVARKRASTRTQGEYRAVLDGMIASVLAVHPWAEAFLFRDLDKNAQELEAGISELAAEGKITAEEKTAMIKLVDGMRMTS